MSISIVVKDIDTGSGISGAVGTLTYTGTGSPKTATSDGMGSMDFGAVDASSTNVKLKVEKTNFSTAEFEADLLTDSVTRLYPEQVFLQDMSMIPVAAKIKCVDSMGSAKPGVTVKLKPVVAGTEVTATTDGMGEALFTVPIGSYRITVEQAGWEKFGCVATLSSGLPGTPSTRFLPKTFVMKALPSAGGAP